LAEIKDHRVQFNESGLNAALDITLITILNKYPRKKNQEFGQVFLQV